MAGRIKIALEGPRDRTTGELIPEMERMCDERLHWALKHLKNDMREMEGVNHGLQITTKYLEDLIEENDREGGEFDSDKALGLLASIQALLGRVYHCTDNHLENFNIAERVNIDQ